MVTQDCRIIQLSVIKRIPGLKPKDTIPTAEIIVIGPKRKEAIDYAKKRLRHYVPYAPKQYGFQLLIKDLGPILLPSALTTVFLYTQQTGRIE